MNLSNSNQNTKTATKGFSSLGLINPVDFSLIQDYGNNSSTIGDSGKSKSRIGLSRGQFQSDINLACNNIPKAPRPPKRRESNS